MSKTELIKQKRNQQTSRSLSIGTNDCACDSLKLKLNRDVKSFDESFNKKIKKTNSNNKLIKNESFPSSNKCKKLFLTQSFCFGSSKLGEVSPELEEEHIKNNNITRTKNGFFYINF